MRPGRTTDRPLPRCAAGVLATLVVLATFATARAGSDPSRRWRTIETRHFQIHYYQGGEPLARRVAVIAEEAYESGRAFLGLEPVETVHVVLRDDTDSANGFTTVYPYDRIELLAYPPGPDSELSTFDDYVRTLFFHEYVHVVHMDAVGGLPRVLNRILGKTALPNGATLAWFTEGLATFAETRLTPGGRVGSSLYDMYLRAAALGRGLLDLQDLTVSPVRQPRGAAPYLYGSYFLDFLWSRRGMEPLAAFIRDYGARIVPFAMNTLARRHYGRDFLGLYEDFRDELQRKARAEAVRVRQRGEVPGRAVTLDGEYHLYPVFTADSRRLVYVRSDGRSTGGLFEADPVTGAERRLADCFGGCGRVFLSDGFAYTTHQDAWRIHSFHADVWRVDGAGREERLTRRSRARDVSVGPDGTLYWVTSEYERVSIRAHPPGKAPERDVVPPGRFAGLAGPIVVPGTSRLVFSGASGGRWDLWATDLAGGDPVRLTDDGCLDRDPAVSPDGRWVVFSTDRDGIYDVHALELATGTVRRATGVVGGAFQPAVSPDGATLAFVAYSDRGYDLATLPFAPASWPLASPADRACRPIAAAGPAAPPSPADDGPSSRAYRAWPSILPRSLVPRYAFTSFEDIRLGAEVSGSDAAARHSVRLGFDTDVRDFAPTASLSYAFDGLYPSLGVDLTTWPSLRSALVDDTWVTVRGRSWIASPYAWLPLPGRARSFALSLSYAIGWSAGYDRPVGHDPASTQPRYPTARRIAGVGLGFAYDSTESWTWSIGPSSGMDAGASLNLYQPWLGGDGSAITASAYADGYVPLPGRLGHVLALRGSGAFSRGDPSTEDAFAIGGFPSQDLLPALVNQSLVSGRFLRGFPAGSLTGNTYVLGSLEYRLPWAWLHRGLDTLPVAARRLWSTVYADAGGAWYGIPGISDFRAGVGAEVALSTTLFLAFEAVFRAGFARGIGPGGENVFYLLLTP